MAATSRPTTSRRGFLLVSGLAVAGAAGGVTTGLLVHRHHDDPAPIPHPAVLLAAADAERALLASLDASLSTAKVPARLLRQLRADHAAHLAAVRSSIAVALGASPSASSSPVAGPARALDAGALRAAETVAAKAAATRALGLTGPDAVLLASIAACEAAHAQLLAQDVS